VLFTLKGNIKNKHIVDQFMINLMKHYRMHTRKSGIINVKFKTTLENDYMGLCTGDRRNVSIWISRDQTFLNQMRTLAHEMVHAKQFLRGELHEDGHRWKGVDCSDLKYAEQPCEIEAWGTEDTLFMSCYPFEIE